MDGGVEKDPNRMLGDRSYGPAKLELHHSQAVPEALRPNLREIVALHVPKGHRGNGIGAELMRCVCAEADREDIVLMLVVQPFDTDGFVDVDAMVRWYGRFGFVPVQQGSAVVMARRIRIHVPPPLKPLSAAVTQDKQAIH